MIRKLVRSVALAGTAVALMTGAGCTKDDNVKSQATPATTPTPPPPQTAGSPQVVARPDHVFGELAIGSPATLVRNAMAYDPSGTITEAFVRKALGHALGIPVAGVDLDLAAPIRGVFRIDGTETSFVFSLPMKPDFLKDFAGKSSPRPDGARMIKGFDPAFAKCAIVPTLAPDSPIVACEVKDATPLTETSFLQMAGYLARGDQSMPKPGVVHATINAKTAIGMAGGIPDKPPPSFTKSYRETKGFEDLDRMWGETIYSEFRTFATDADTFSADFEVGVDTVSATLGVDEQTPKSMIALMMRSFRSSSPWPADMPKITKGTMMGVGNVDNLPATLAKLQTPMTDLVHKMCAWLGWDKSVVGSFDKLFEMSKSFDYHHMAFRADGSMPSAKNLSTKPFVTIGSMDVPFDSFKPMWAEWSNILSNKSLYTRLEKEVAPHKIDAKFAQIPAAKLPKGALGMSLLLANPYPETCKPTYKPAPFPCSFSIQYVLVPQGKGTLFYEAFGAKLDDIKTSIAKSLAKSDADSILAVLPADKPGMQVALTLDYWLDLLMPESERPKGVTIDTHGIFIESIWDDAKGDDLALRVGLSVDKAMIQNVTKLYLQIGTGKSSGPSPVTAPPNGQPI